MTNLLWIVDTQNDFFDTEYEVYGQASRAKPALSVPGSKIIRENLGLLSAYTKRTENWCSSGSLDAHTDQDVKHFSRWPVHCLKGYAGYFPIPEVDARDWNEFEKPIARITMKNQSDASLDYYRGLLGLHHLVFFEKGERPEDTDPNACNSCRVNPNVAPMLSLLQPKMIVICGLALGYCVKEARDYFKELGYKVALVTDAIKEFSAEELALYGKWHAEGDILVHTSDVIEGKL
jgi:nicotinamidase-related amidase